MLKAIIIEDEKPAMEALVENLAGMIPAVEIKARLTSVKESISFLKQHENADIIFSDVQLADGLSFEIFSATGIQIPVIFTTGYDEFIMKAFECNGIDYLLKPIGKEDLSKALSKYYTLQKHFANKPPDIQKLNGYLNHHEKKRILVKKGSEHIPLRTDEIAFFITENKIVFAIDNEGKKFMTDKTLSDLEMELDPAAFFRANRQHLINIDYVHGFRTFDKVKIEVHMTTGTQEHQIIISQETAPGFRKWINEA